ncbi:MAG: DNA mismatch repair endonuclease MutL [Nitrospirota bacterium]
MIILLPEHLSNKIAAGEVVERPASVVKELVENAIDAKSNKIVISLLEGGVRQIAVCDNGEGMSPEDARLAFCRHATSKLEKEEDLLKLSTLGFRGEALPSIASISQLRLVTQTADCHEGIEIILSGGVVEKTGGIGAPTGSTFIVSNLFFNTPARKKFLKSTETELGHISQMVFQLALAHPQIDFQLSHEKRKLLAVPAVSSQKDRLIQLYGEAVMGQVIEAETSFPNDGIAIHAFFSKAPVLKNNRKDQLFFVNRRCIKNPAISHALYEGYGSFLMKGEHPFGCLFLSIDPNRVDVNVHPAKKEVRFQNADTVYRSVRNLIREKLSGGGHSSFYENRERTPKENPMSLSKNSGQASATAVSKVTSSEWAGWPESNEGKATSYPSARVNQLIGDPTGRLYPLGGAATLFEFSNDVPLIRPIGQIYRTFLLADLDGEFVVVDQHTAHERILYESFLKKRRLEIQPLLIPRPIDLSLTRATFILDALPLLQESGFKIEPFGETTFLVREMPAELSQIDMELFLSDLADDLAETGVVKENEDQRFKIVASMACHAAVRAGRVLTLDEITAILHDYFKLNTPPTCPHGRPIIIKYPLLELEKMFRRK